MENIIQNSKYIFPYIILTRKQREGDEDIIILSKEAVIKERGHIKCLEGVFCCNINPFKTTISDALIVYRDIKNNMPDVEARYDGKFIPLKFN